MSLRRILKRDTSELHRALDGLVVELKSFESRENYGRWLGAMREFHGQVRQAFCLASIGPHEVRRQDERIERLLRDLEAFTAPAMPATPARPLAIEDAAAALGVRYVVEGASLGARILSCRAAALGFTPDRGARYLAAEAQSVAAWQDLLAVLATTELDAAATARAVAAGRRTFELAAHCLGGLCHA